MTDTVKAVAASLVSVQRVAELTFVSLPMFYPSGAAIAVQIERFGSRFSVSDGGFAYREVMLIGGESRFARAASAVSEECGVQCAPPVVFAQCEVETLASSIADVGMASFRIAHAIVDRLAAKDDDEITLYLYQRLVGVFGAPRVETEAKVVGASNTEWEISALVHLDNHNVAFDAVSNHHSSVYASATKFRDLALLERRPVTVSVVRDKAALGHYLAILAQAGHVIEGGVPDETFVRAAAA